MKNRFFKQLNATNGIQEERPTKDSNESFWNQ